MIRATPSAWQEAILVCGKCTKRLGGGFGKKGRTPLAKALHAAGLGGRRRKDVRGIVETGCLKLCPKRAVVVLNTAHPQNWCVVPGGTALSEVARALGIKPLTSIDPMSDDMALPPHGALE